MNYLLWCSIYKDTQICLKVSTILYFKGLYVSDVLLSGFIICRLIRRF
jgi:hypothetical protein